MTQHQSASASDVNAQLADIKRRGGGMARLAHVSSGLLLVAFSLGSLISISAAATLHFLSQWNAGVFDLPDAINITVNMLLVVCADVALLYAASVLRTLIEGQASAEEMRTHQWAMFGAAALETASYLYLVWTFDRPTTLFLWAIAIARSLGAPLFAAYLSMARPLPVGPRDIAYYTSLFSGQGLIHDVATLAADPNASLARKTLIYAAAAPMTEHDRKRFDAIIKAVSTETPADDEGTLDGAAYTPPGRPRPALPAPRTPNGPYPTGGGTPGAMPFWSFPGEADDTFPPARRWESAAETRSDQSVTVAGPVDEDDLRKASEEAARWFSAQWWLDHVPGMSVEALRKELGCRQQDASGYVQRWQLIPGNRARRDAAKAAKKRAQAATRESQDDATADVPAVPVLTITHPVAQ